MTKSENVPMYFLAGGTALVVLLFVLLLFSLKPEPCGYVNSDGSITAGYLLKGKHSATCFECKSLEDARWRDGLDWEDELRVCPKETLTRYNESAARLNAELVKAGYEPRYKIYKEK